MTKQAWLLAAILLAAFILRFWNLDAPKMGADESLHYFPEMQQIHRLPFSQQRLHPTDLYHATSPNPVGHPLFATQVVNLAMRLFGATETTGRGVMALAGVLLVGLTYLLGRDLYSARHGLIAAAIACLLPLAVRYQRTLYLDPIYSLLTAAWIWCLFQAWQPAGALKWTAAAGILLGLAAASKTSAPILAVLAMAYVAWRWRPAAAPPAPARPETKRARRKARRVSQSRFPGWLYTPPARLALMVGLALLVFLVFVAPGPYIQAIRNPVDTAYQNRSAAFYLNHLWQQRTWLAGVALTLWTPPVLIAAAAGLVIIARRWRLANSADALLLLWLAATGPLLFVHLAGLSGEHGYLSFVAPVALLAAVAVAALPQRWLAPALVAILLPMLPATLLYGHRLLPTPYNSYLNNVDAPITPSP
ncbi:MAG: glycosyltransferase family 39 protein [Chloroflexi bacterium]|nr:glycosyltransferase family 39 protein [Chloroflexota bacterium]MCI0574640.1 glycosyltransferase family 39 protein [Chloroflexota bacterium]MCI0649078.1 glycosyltransferase family 39 protein [Chloroflexota bacterium]MCI0730533.1 glycosyltransferase family 39 protein [Chloroflexota bacterium]